MEFEQFVAIEGPSLTRYAYLLCGDRHGAEDLTQAALLKAFQKWPRISRLEDPGAYVRRIVTREFLTAKRRKASSERVTANIADELQAPRMADHADRVVGDDALWHLLRTLPAKQRAVLVLRYYLDLPFEEIGSVLRCTAGTARSHASRALDTIRASESLSTEDV